MSIPSCIFIDTSVLEAIRYNFRNSEVISIRDAATRSKIRYLLPSPTEREISRHIADLANSVGTELRKAAKSAPFLSRWKCWPTSRTEFAEISSEVRMKAVQEWNEFLEKFQVIRLPLIGIELDRIMSWYEECRAPFGQGAKRKEFPDAFAIALLLKFAAENGEAIAVVSRDADFKKACARSKDLMHYESLNEYAEAVLGDDLRTDAVKKLIDKDKKPITDAIRAGFEDLGFLVADAENDSVSDVKTGPIVIEDLRIVALGTREATAAFSAKVDFSAHIEYDDLDSAAVDSSEGIFMPLHRRGGRVENTAEISGSMKVHFDLDAAKIGSVGFLSIDQNWITVEGEVGLIEDDDYPDDMDSAPQAEEDVEGRSDDQS